MPPKATRLDHEAVVLGFTCEEEMLHEMYKHHSIRDLARKFGWSWQNMRVRLLRAGVTLRTKGGANNVHYNGE